MMIMLKVLLRKGFLFAMISKDIRLRSEREHMMTTHEHSTNINLKRRATYAGAALMLTGSLAACGGEKAPAMCESPRATSALFPADPNATKDHATWKNSIAIRTEVPTDADDVIVGYRGQNADTWNDSRPISPDRAQTIVALLGDGAVSFSVHVIAIEGSAACTNKPAVTFSEPQPAQPLIAADATLPQW